jgi:hypothetical protein
MLSLYCVLYALGDLLRARWFARDATPDAVGVSVGFFVLSLWLVANSIVYYRAFLDEMDEAADAAAAAAETTEAEPNAGGAAVTIDQEAQVSPAASTMDAGGQRNRLGSMTGEDARTNHIEGTGVSFALAAAAAEGALTAGFSPSNDDSCSNSVEAGSDPTTTTSSADATGSASAVSVSVTEPSARPFGPRRRWGEGLRGTWRRWTFHLRSEVGLAYFLNIVGSVGYVVSSLITLFLTVEQIGSARQIDRASLALDCVNMLLFSVDGVLFFHVWWRENPAQTFRGKMRSVYFWANLANTASSVAYFAFVVWALRQRFRLAEEEAAHAQQQDKAGSSSWYNTELVHVQSRQRSLYFGADVVYLLYAALLELGWSREHGQQEHQKQHLDANASGPKLQQQQQQQQQLQMQQLPLRHRKKDSARVTPKSPSQGGSHDIDDDVASKSDGAIIFSAAAAANANATAISATKDVQLHLKDNA